MTYLFQDSTTNGNSPSTIHNGGSLALLVRGTFGGATVKLQLSDNNTDWVDINDALFTSAAAKLLTIPAGAFVRANIAGGAGASLTVVLI